MDHSSSTPFNEGADVIKFKTRIGIILFFIYAAVYGVFVAINTILPQSMKINVLFGLNLAIFYGFLLIILAIIMGLIYNAVCSRKERQYEESNL